MTEEGGESSAASARSTITPMGVLGREAIRSRLPSPLTSMCRREMKAIGFKARRMASTSAAFRTRASTGSSASHPSKTLRTRIAIASSRL